MEKDIAAEWMRTERKAIEMVARWVTSEVVGGRSAMLGAIYNL
jgi:hypothetical protein